MLLNNLLMMMMLKYCRAGRICQETDPETDAVWTIRCSNFSQSTSVRHHKLFVKGMINRFFCF